MGLFPVLKGFDRSPFWSPKQESVRGYVSVNEKLQAPTRKSSLFAKIMPVNPHV